MRYFMLLPMVLILGAGCTTYTAKEPLRSEGAKESAEASSAVTAGPETEEVVPAVKERPFEEAGIGFTGPSEKEYRSFFSREEMLSLIPPEDMFAEVDFSRDMVLACFMGEKPTGGYMNRIARLEESSELITVFVEITKPAEGDLVAQMLTYPWYAVVTERSHKTLEWTEVRAER